MARILLLPAGLTKEIERTAHLQVREHRKGADAAVHELVVAQAQQLQAAQAAQVGDVARNAAAREVERAQQRQPRERVAELG